MIVCVFGGEEGEKPSVMKSVRGSVWSVEDEGEGCLLEVGSASDELVVVELDESALVTAVEAVELAEVSEVDAEVDVLVEAEGLVAVRVEAREGGVEGRETDVVAGALEGLDQLVDVETVASIAVKEHEAVAHGEEVLVHGHELVQAFTSEPKQSKGQTEPNKKA